MYIILKIGVFLMNILYLLFKLFPTKNKITFISRQSDSINIDFKLIMDEINKEQPSVKVVALCKKIKTGLLSKIKYIFHMFVQMYHVATSKVVVLDSYCIVVSCLKHKKILKVVQMWHAMGAFKKFGYSILDKDEGHSSKIASLMKMHNNYDYVFCSSNACILPFAEAFNISCDKVKVFPLPRVDLLKSDKYKKEKKSSLYSKYPILKGKKNILYAPTFRKNVDVSLQINELIKKVDYSKYNLILKLHPLVENSYSFDDKEGLIIDKGISTFDFSFVSDYIITDYSATIFELMLLEKPIYFWTFDLDEYVNERDFYLDYTKDIPGVKQSDINIILKDIDNCVFDIKKQKTFIDKYVYGGYNSNTYEISKFLLKLLSL